MSKIRTNFLKGFYLLNISEIFYSLQGEGRFVGHPSVFVRFGGCNLRCEGFGGGCDSRYAVDLSFKESWSRYDADRLKQEYENKKVHRYADTVLTGGEPTLWFGNPDFMSFAEYLLSCGSLVTVETNATKEVDFGFAPFSSFVYALSVKLSNSGEKKEDRIKHTTLRSFVNTVSHFFKFVLDVKLITSGRAKEEIDELKAEFGILPQNIYCMPLGVSKEEINANAKAVFEFCAKEGYSYSDRLHIRVYDKKRGV